MSLAIAYAVKKKNKKAHGGLIKPSEALSEANKFQLAKEDLVQNNKSDMEGPHTGHPVKNEYYSSDEMPPKFMDRGGMIDAKEMAQAIMNKKSKGGMSCYAEGGLVQDENLGRNRDSAQPMHKRSDQMFNDSASYELGRESDDLSNPASMWDDGDGSMPYGEEALYKSANENMEDLRDHLPSDAEHEVEGMNGMRQAMARKGMLTRILGNIRSKNMGR